MQAKGKTGSVDLSADAVTVHRKGTVRWRAAVPASEKRIPFDQILAVRMRSASPLGNGSLEFVVDGWARGENAVSFSYRQQRAFEALSVAVASRVAARSRLCGAE
jgi:hypothetical protein